MKRQIREYAKSCSDSSEDRIYSASVRLVLHLFVEKLNHLSARLNRIESYFHQDLFGLLISFVSTPSKKGTYTLLMLTAHFVTAPPQRSWVKGELSTEPDTKLADLEGVFSAMSMEDAAADQDVV
ncbi:hypothetical protein LINPERHAP1_LOCUS6068 [Linum perenne]